jgi:hypothetical protein
MGECELDSSVSGLGRVTESCGHGSEPFGFTRGGQLLCCSVVIHKAIFITLKSITTQLLGISSNLLLSQHASTFTMSSSRLHYSMFFKNILNHVKS